MVIIKSYTDLGQSRKLAEILPFESADMGWNVFVDGTTRILPINDWDLVKDGSGNVKFYPAWSLAALLDVLPVDWWGYNKHYFLEISKMGDASKPYEVKYYRFREQSDGASFGRITHISYQADNPIDACYGMILRLHEQGLL